MALRLSLLAGVLGLTLGCEGTWAGDVPETVPQGQVPGQAQKLPPRGARHFMTDPPGAPFYPQYLPGPYSPYMSITGAPAYQWGYFGARSKPNRYSHSGFHRDVTDWFLPRR